MDPRLNEFFNFVYTTILQSKRSIEEQHDLNFLQLINEKIESIESMLSVIINNYEDTCYTPASNNCDNVSIDYNICFINCDICLS